MQAGKPVVRSEGWPLTGHPRHPYASMLIILPALNALAGIACNGQRVTPGLDARPSDDYRLMACVCGVRVPEFDHQC